MANNYVRSQLGGNKNKLNDQLAKNDSILKDLNNVNQVYKKNEQKIEKEISKSKNNKLDDVKEAGKKLLKGFGL